MRERVTDIMVRTIALCMIAVFTVMAVNRVVNVHMHMLADGTIVTHAHPYDKSADSTPFKTHHHTSAQLLFFEQLEILIFIAFVLFLLSPVLTHFRFPISRILHYSPACVCTKRGRAPPVQ